MRNLCVNGAGLFLLGWLALGFPIQAWAQAVDLSAKESSKWKTLVEKQKLETHLRVSLKDGRKIQGVLQAKETDSFRLANSTSHVIPYNSVKGIKTGLSLGHRIRRDIRGAVRVVSGVSRAAMVFTLFAPIAIPYLIAVQASPSPSDFPTVPGPEAADLISSVQGTVVFETDRGEIEQITLPLNLKQKRRIYAPGMGYTHLVSGPAQDGSIAFIEGSLCEKRHLLKVLGRDRTENLIFERKGDAIWDHVTGGLALSPLGNQIATIGPLQRRQMYHPQVLLQAGPIEIWDVQTRTCKQTGLTALADAGLAWSADGKRLFYTGFVPREQFTAGGWSRFEHTHPTNQAKSAAPFGSWKMVPAVCVHDFETGRQTILSPGWKPVLSFDETYLLLSDFDHQWKKFDLATGAYQAVSVPGLVTPLGFLRDGLLAYTGLPTAGSEVRLTTNNSPLVGPKLTLTVKLADLQSGSFQTVIPYLDPRTDVRVGR